ncbi:uncharacterized protein LOC124539759 isoform X3 [Vanessa cardui]|uniref:uncharacterized protein LOC124539759 isoform X3 n=1 Tax=Vanessa cardui TaxID=171605 RepID=UPI001F1467EA|nr:uncharacterized protein LOC124539759 isoform X3 [Vanessa cardui]
MSGLFRIFLGCIYIFLLPGATTCLVLLPIAALVVAVTVVCVHHALAHKQSQSVRQEIIGIVAELRGCLLLTPRTERVPIHIQLVAEKHSAYSQYKIISIMFQVIGTVSISEFWGPHNRGWLHAMVVHPKWRGRGVARALAGAARCAAAARGLAALDAALSHLQAGARAALHAAGWECRAAYERPLCGAALTLPLVRLGLDLPLA